MEPIGIMETPFPQKFGIPRQGSLVPEARGTLYFYKKNVPHGALDGLEVNDFLWILFRFHRSSAIGKGKIYPPRLQGASVGIFASRTPHRPNPIGMTLCQLESVDRDSLKITVKGVDMLDQTPVLDIKPYSEYADRPQPGFEKPWHANPPESIENVQIEDAAVSQITLLDIPETLVALALKCAAMDPRPVHQNQSQTNYWMQLDRFDFCFVFESQKVTLKAVKIAKTSS